MFMLALICIFNDPYLSSTLGLLQKERDLELAARIGQSLLKKNKALSERNELLEEQVEHIREEVCYRVYGSIWGWGGVDKQTYFLSGTTSISPFIPHLGFAAASWLVHERWAAAVLHQRSGGKWGRIPYLYTVSRLIRSASERETVIHLIFMLMSNLTHKYSKFTSMVIKALK